MNDFLRGSRRSLFVDIWFGAIAFLQKDEIGDRWFLIFDWAIAEKSEDASVSLLFYGLSVMAKTIPIQLRLNYKYD